MALSTSTGSLAVGASRTFNLSPGSALTLVAPPNCRVTVTETPNTVSASGVGGNASRVHNLQLGQTVTYGPYPMGGTVVVANASNSGGAVTWVRSDALVAESASGVVSLVDGDGNNVLRTPLPQNANMLFGPGDGQTLTFTNAGGVTVDASGVETIDGEEWRWWTITGISGTLNRIEVIVPTFAPITADNMLIQWRSSVINSGISVGAYLGTTAFAQSITSSSNNGMSAASVSGWRGHTGTIQGLAAYTELTKAGFSRDTLEQAWTDAKVRITVPNGVTTTIKLRALYAGARRRKGRLCVVADDASALFMDLGAQILDRYGIPSTIAVIGDAIGNGNAYFTSEKKLRDYVARGNLCVAHGPRGGVGDYFSTNPTDAGVIADMQYHRDWCLARGLTTTKGAQCVVWPQGQWARTAGDPSFLDLAWAAGFRAGRLADPTAVRQYNAPLVAAGRWNLLQNNIGHRYAGAFSTADDATETTNVGTVVTGAQFAAAAGMDTFLTLHEVVPRGAAVSAIQIETDRLHTICAAIQTLVAAGTLECVLMDAFVP